MHRGLWPLGQGHGFARRDPQTRGSTPGFEGLGRVRLPLSHRKSAKIQALPGFWMLFCAMGGGKAGKRPAFRRAGGSNFCSQIQALAWICLQKLIGASSTSRKSAQIQALAWIWDAFLLVRRAERVLWVQPRGSANVGPAS